MERSLELPVGRFAARNLNGALLPVLIEVPAMRAQPIRSSRIGSARSLPRGRVRRRLKRKVRAAVAAICILAPGLGAGPWVFRVARTWSEGSFSPRPNLTETRSSSAATEPHAAEVERDGRQSHAPAIQPGVVVPVYGPDEDLDHAGS